MMIYIDLTVADFISLYGLGFLCTLFFLISGIMMVVTKNPNLISKNEFSDITCRCGAGTACPPPTGSQLNT